MKMIFKALYNDKIYDVVALDWSKGIIISAHLKRNNKTIKVYPGNKYGDDVKFLQGTDKIDELGNEIWLKEEMNK